MKRFILYGILVLAAGNIFAQQVADSIFSPIVSNPEYRIGRGPVITLDEAHFNFHTLEGRYKAFGDLLSKDGYKLQRGTKSFTLDYLRKTRILAIANALAENDNWRLPTRPAFARTEVDAVRKWVEEGGRLLLIADHMPCAGAAAELAAAFGFEFYNGFAMKRGMELFYRSKGNLLPTSITDGRSGDESVDTIRVFTGQGFKVPSEAIIFTQLDSTYTIMMPDEAWEFNDSTRRVSGEGFAHGAYRKFGKGRVVMVAEAAMFSAQLAGPNASKMGMNHPTARNNPQLLLNIIHWLDGRID